MATIKVNSPRKLYVKFDEKELRPYGGITAIVTQFNGVKFIDAYMPNITYRGHEGRVFEDLIEALKAVGNFAAKLKGVKAGWIAKAHRATIDTETKIRIPVYQNVSSPYVQFERLAVDGKPKTYIEGHYFNDDLPSIRAYVAAITKLKQGAWDRRFI
jgi:hypothetical protein